LAPLERIVAQLTGRRSVPVRGAHRRVRAPQRSWARRVCPDPDQTACCS
jgi:hypothetical protein